MIELATTELLEASLELGAPAPDGRELTWDQFIGHHRVMHFARSARPRCRVLKGPRVPFGNDGLRLVRVELDRPDSPWMHDQGIAAVDGDSVVSVAAHGVVFTEPALRGEGYSTAVNSALYLSHPELYLERKAAIYPASGLSVVRRSFENLIALGVLVVPE